MSSSSANLPDIQQTKRPRFDPGRLPANREEVDVKLRESAEYLQEWSLLMDKTENLPTSEISKGDLLKHVSLKRKLHENLGILARLAQIHTMKAKQNLLQQQPRNNIQLDKSIGLPQTAQVEPRYTALEGDINTSSSAATTNLDYSTDAVPLSDHSIT